MAYVLATTHERVPWSVTTRHIDASVEPQTIAEQDLGKVLHDGA